MSNNGTHVFHVIEVRCIFNAEFCITLGMHVHVTSFHVAKLIRVSNISLKRRQQKRNPFCVHTFVSFWNF